MQLFLNGFFTGRFPQLPTHSTPNAPYNSTMYLGWGVLGQNSFANVTMDELHLWSYEIDQADMRRIIALGEYLLQMGIPFAFC